AAGEHQIAVRIAIKTDRFAFRTDPKIDHRDKTNRQAYEYQARATLTVCHCQQPVVWAVDVALRAAGACLEHQTTLVIVEAACDTGSIDQRFEHFASLVVAEHPLL